MTAPKLTPKQLGILQHALGTDQYGRGTRYRNRYVVGPGCYGFTVCQELVRLGPMEDSGPNSMCQGYHFFHVTAAGNNAILEQSPVPPKLTRSQKRYQRFLDADSGMRFGEWLKTKWAKDSI